MITIAFTLISIAGFALAGLSFYHIATEKH